MTTAHTQAGLDAIELTARLVAIESVNPQLDSTGSGEGEIAGFVADWCRAAGMSAELVDHGSGRISVVARSAKIDDAAAAVPVSDPPVSAPVSDPPVSAPTLLLCGHLDTVGFGSMDQPLTPRVDGDRMYGRGSYDMKAGLAAVLIAARELRDAGVNIVVAAVADEEHASIGVQGVLEHLGPDFTADLAVVTEPTEMELGVAHRGFVWVEVTVHGRAAHGSRPHLGVDAIAKAGAFLVRLEQLGKDLAAVTHPLLGAGVVHASLIEGGQEPSTIPERCTIVLERRTLPGETVADIAAEVQGLIDACAAADPDFAAEARVLMDRPPMETDSPLVDLAQRAHRQVRGADAPLVGMSYWADSAFIAERGIPTVLYGPGGDGAHAEVEWVSLTDTADCTAVLIGLGRSLAR